MLFLIIDYYEHSTASMEVIIKRLLCLRVMCTFSVILIWRSGFFLPPLYIGQAVCYMNYNPHMYVSTYNIVLR